MPDEKKTHKFKEQERDQAPQLVREDGSIDSSVCNTPGKESSAGNESTANNTSDPGGGTAPAVSPRTVPPRKHSIPDEPLPATRWQSFYRKARTPALVIALLIVGTFVRHYSEWYSKLPRPPEFRPENVSSSTFLAILGNPEISYATLSSYPRKNQPGLSISEKVKRDYLMNHQDSPMAQVLLMTAGNIQMDPNPDPASRNENKYISLTANEQKRYVESLVARYPDNYLLGVLVADVHADGGERDRALTELDKVMESLHRQWNQPRKPLLSTETVLLCVARQLEAQGRPEAAMKYLDKYPELQGNSSDATIFRAAVHAANKENELAKKEVLQALKQIEEKEEKEATALPGEYPANRFADRDTLYELGRILTKIGDYSRAEDVAARLYDWRSVTLRSEILAAQGKWAEAWEALGEPYQYQGYAYEPDQIRLRALICLNSGKYQDARDYIDQSSAASSGGKLSNESLRIRARANLHLKNYAECLADCERILTRDPAHADALAMMSQIPANIKAAR